MNIFKAIGYICLGCGSVFLIFALFSFFSIFVPFRQNPYLAQIATTTALAGATPLLIAGSGAYVVGGVMLLVGRDIKKAFSIVSHREKVTEEDLLDRVSRIEGIVDNNFNVITKRLDEIEEKQNMFSQNTIIKAKRE